MMFFLTAASYFIGSIPFGLLIAKMNGVDITKTGSGNTGATNVFRTMGKGWGVGVFALDFFKGAIPVYLAQACFSDHLLIMACGAAAILGHMYSPFLNFKGGKGVATGLGVVFAVAPYLFITSFVLGIAIIAASGYVSVASITGSVLLSILMFTTGKPAPYAWGILILTVFIIYKHIPNMKRLIKGTENKIRLF